MKKLTVASGLSLTFLVSGCMSIGVGKGMGNIPSDAAQDCSAQCHELGMDLTAMVVMAGKAGCVCEPQQATGGVTPTAASTAGGMAAIVVQLEAQQRSNTQAAAH